ncbi:DUF4279 domain-containing protein [Microbulbifer sp. Q7]|uniref:DUF4279 domain-containing protein n=1 Tax=Microbulbifer sp. Q7 TaxID=1785091 RepID=UPI0009EDFF41|nr:DUF4279 domain-containing protein [Microbulbifer sp. Q7]
MACIRTYVSLCVYSPDLLPDQISNALSLEPTTSFCRDPQHKYYPQRQHNFWSISTKELLESTDQKDHLKKVFTFLQGKEEILSRLKSSGCETKISVYYETDGQDGPYLDSASIMNLARYELEIWWDIYHFEPDEDEDT